MAQERENNMAERQCVSITITCAISILLGIESNTVYGTTSHLEKIIRLDTVVIDP